MMQEFIAAVKKAAEPILEKCRKQEMRNDVWICNCDVSMFDGSVRIRICYGSSEDPGDFIDEETGKCSWDLKISPDNSFQILD